MSTKYLQGIFIPKHPEKYVGNVNNIVFRSSWERKFLLWADNNPAVIKYASEEIVIPYHSPVDQKMHRYFTDFAIRVRTKNGEEKNYLIEIKPEIQTKPPKPRTRNTNKYINELSTYAVNQAKWNAAVEYCNKNNMTFQILTERDLFKK